MFCYSCYISFLFFSPLVRTPVTSEGEGSPEPPAPRRKATKKHPSSVPPSSRAKRPKEAAEEAAEDPDYEPEEATGRERADQMIDMGKSFTLSAHPVCLWLRLM